METEYKLAYSFYQLGNEISYFTKRQQ